MTNPLDVLGVLRCHADGKSLVEAAADLQVPYWRLRKQAVDMGLTFHHHWSKGRNQPSVRSREMAALYRAGATLQQIGNKYGVTRERVRQIITRWHGLTAKKGGAHVLAVKAETARNADTDARYIAAYGCTHAQHRQLKLIGKEMRQSGRGIHQTPLAAFATQRSNAKRRSVDWDLTLWQWWTLWQESGRWDQRGRSAGYVMARVGDSGPYSAANVYITTGIENIRDSLAVRGLVWSGLPTGVRASGERFAAYRSINGKQTHLGTFNAPDEAHAAYLAAAPKAGIAA